MIIAVDGTASSGKGTLAKRLAAHYRLPHLDTGLLYRAVGRRMLDFGRRLDDEGEAATIARAFARAWLDDPRLRSAETGIAASRVAIIPEVRLALRAYQQDFARRPEGAVLDGRDIGTVIAPDADAKLWVTATPEKRAQRRWRELAERGDGVSEADVLAELTARDARDAPNMIRATDALLLDTSELDIETAFRTAVRLIDGKLRGTAEQRRPA